VALPGSGFRNCLSVMLEMSFHLMEPYMASTLVSPVVASGSSTVIVGSLGYPINALYSGAQIVIGSGVNQEIVQVSDVDVPSNSFTATFAYTHPVGTIVQGATFPTQAASGDYFFSQREIAGYLARAQHEFMAEVPCVYGLNTQTVQIGQVYQPLICSAIQMERVASSSQYVALTSLTRAANVVTSVTQSPHGLVPGQKFSVYNPNDPSFTGAFKVLAVVNATSFTYKQVAANLTTSGGAIVLWLRLLETSSEELSIQNPFWRDQNITRLRAWGEDRSGNYRWLVDGKPASSFPCGILVSQRDTDSLELTDYFLVPDPILHAVKYKALAYCWGKNGEARDPLRQKYCDMRFNRLVLATRRWMDGTGMNTGSPESRMTGQ